MEGWSLLGPRFHAPTRRDASLSSKPGASCSRAASRSRWKPTRGVWRQHPQLSSLSAARAMPMAGECDGETAPGECVAASAPGGSRTAALARLEPQSAPTRLYATGATATHRGGPVTSHRFAIRHGRDSLPCAARALAPLVGRVLRSQCPSGHGWASDGQALRRSRRLCSLTRAGNGLMLSCHPMASFFSDHQAAPSGASCSLVSAGPPFFLSVAGFVLYLAGLTVSSGFLVRSCFTFVSQSPAHSSTTSLRIP